MLTGTVTDISQVCSAWTNSSSN